MKRMLLALCLLAFAVAYAIGGGARVVDKVLYAEFATDTTGDTCQVAFIAPAYGIDSFAYIDSFSYHNDTTAHKTITWTSHPQHIIITPVIVDSSSVVSCSVAFAAQTLGFAVDPGDAYITVAKICDTLTYLFNNTTNLKDSVLAQDSGTYVKLKSKISQVTLTARWSFIYAVTGGTATFDTASTITTVAMVCDTMAAKINASANLDSFVTAANSGDTGYTVTSDDNGVPFFVAVKDTTQDTSTTQLNVTSVSAITDTFTLAEFGPSLVENDFRGSGVQGWIILHPCSDTNQGFGLSDSAKIWLYSVEKVDSNLIWTILDQDSCSSLPCTCRVNIIHAAANDTIFDYNLGLGYRIRDTLTDTVINASYRLSVDLIITDGF